MPFEREALRSISTPTATPASTARQARRIPGQLVLVLDAAALVEEALVGGQLDPVRAQVVGVAEREARRRDRSLEAELLAGAEVELAVERVAVELLA